jgi:hypothetical protein
MLARCFLGLALIGALVLAQNLLAAGIPQSINYQGYLADASGNPVPTGPYQITFAIYNTPIGGLPLWSSGSQTINVTNGMFNAYLGASPMPPLPSNLFSADTIRYLGITIGSDPEISPRTHITSAAYSYQTLRSDTSVYASTIADNSVSSYKIQDGTISNVDINAAAGISPSKISGTAATLSGAQTFTANNIFSSDLKIGDSTLWANSNGINIGTASVAPSSGYTAYMVRHFNVTGAARYGLFNYVFNSSTGTLFGISSTADHTTAGGGGDAYGVAGYAYSDGYYRYGVYGNGMAKTNDIGTGYSYGLFGTAHYGAHARGVYGYAYNATTNYAGYFSGNVNVTGNLSKGGGSFKIDHPLDPENKYLQHSFVESPDMMNIYNGNIILDDNGSATIEMPEWFKALNKDFRYQLTPIGAPGPNLYVAEEINSDKFQIAGGLPNMKVSWQVTGIRKDRWAEANRIKVEVDKQPDERGKYVHPEAYGLSIEHSVDYESIKAAKEEHSRHQQKE